MLMAHLVAACVCAFPPLRLRIDQNPESSMADPHDTVFSLLTAGLVLPFIANMVFTILIAVRVWHLSPHKDGDLGRSPGIAWAVIGMVVESGMLYLVVQITFIVLFAIQHPAQVIAEVVAAQIYVCCHHLKENRFLKTTQGIAPALIMIHVALGLSPSSTEAGSTSRPLPAATQVRIGFSTSAFSDSYSKEIPTSPINSEPSGGIVGLGSSFSSAGIVGVA